MSGVVCDTAGPDSKKPAQQPQVPVVNQITGENIPPENSQTFQMIEQEKQIEIKSLIPPQVENVGNESKQEQQQKSIETLNMLHKVASVDNNKRTQPGVVKNGGNTSSTYEPKEKSVIATVDRHRDKLLSNPRRKFKLPNTVNFCFDWNTYNPLLIDTGASVSVIPFSKCKNLDVTIKKKLQTFGGTPINVCGSCTLTIDLGFGDLPPHDFIVVEEHADYFLLGIDFLRVNSLVPRIDKNMLEQTSTGFSAPTIYFTEPTIADFGVDLFWSTYLSNSPLKTATDKVNLIAATLNYTSEDYERWRDLCLKILDKRPELLQIPNFKNPPKHNHVFYIEKTSDFRPFHPRARRASAANLKAARENFSDLLERGGLKRGLSHCVSPITFATKKDGTTRVCIDYTTLNKYTVTMTYPIPLIQSLPLHLTSRHKIFSVIDMTEAYHQIPMSDEASKLAAIITEFGTFLPLRTPYGLKNAPAFFCKLVADIVNGMESFVFTYLDDFLIFSENIEQHLVHLDQLFQRLSDFGMFIKKEKCHFARKSVLFLGHEISADGMRPLTDKVEAINAMDPPTNLRELRSFLGSINYYRRFLPMLSEKSAPLTDLLKGPTRTKTARIVWNREQQSAFETIKNSLAEAATLANEDPTAPLVLSTDASSHHIGAVLEQFVDLEETGTRPLAFYSKALPTTVRVRSAFNRELTAIYFSLKNFRHRIRGRHLIIRSDNKSVVRAIESITDGDHSPNEGNMIQLIKEFSPTLRHIPGKENQIADLLSRPAGHNIYDEEDKKTDPEIICFINVLTQHFQTDPASIKSVEQKNDEKSNVSEGNLEYKNCEEPVTITPALIASAQELDPQAISETRVLASNVKNKMLIEGRQLLSNERLTCYGVTDLDAEIFRPIVPSHLRAVVFRLIHNTTHPGNEKSLELIKCRYFWPKMDKDIHLWVKTCPDCQKNKISRHMRQKLQNYPPNQKRLNTFH